MTPDRPASVDVQNAVAQIHIGTSFASRELDNLPGIKDHHLSQITKILDAMSCLSKHQVVSGKTYNVYTRTKLAGDVCEGCMFNVSNTKTPARTWRCPMLSEESK